jgi:hypothetical protein
VADLPVQAPIRSELVVNLWAAKVLASPCHRRSLTVGMPVTRISTDSSPEFFQKPCMASRPEAAKRDVITTPNREAESTDALTISC